MTKIKGIWDFWLRSFFQKHKLLISPRYKQRPAPDLEKSLDISKILHRKCMNYIFLSRKVSRSGYPKNIFSEKQILPRIFRYLRTAKNFYMTVPFMYNFRSLSNKLATIFWSLIFALYFTGKTIFLSKKKSNLKFSDPKMWWREKLESVSLS